MRSAAEATETGERPQTASRPRLVGLSFLMLFVELALIRWTGSHVLYLSYFSNFVLLGSFLGIGIGFLRARAKRDLFPYAPVALAFLVGFVRIFPVEIDRSGGQLVYFGSFVRTGLPVWVTLPVIFIVVAVVMALIAEGVARTFVEFRPLEAYRLDILGSLAGIAAFTLLSFLQLPPVGWGLCVVFMFLVLLPRPIGALHVVALVGLVVMLGRESLLEGQSWSPYYRVTTSAEHDGRIAISVNGIPHQTMTGLAQIRAMDEIYLMPYELAGPVEEVLIVGAGTGNDVSVALGEGASGVTAVEIDPRIQAIGREMHPDRPYDDPRVRVVIDDGRAFLERSEERFDLIVFALPDSLTLVSSQSQLRLESYLFTLEAFEEARRHLRPGGTFAMYNYYRERWLVDRLAGTLAEVFDRAPCVHAAGPGQLALLAVQADGDAASCAAWASSRRPAPEPATDEYPFLYLRERGIPAPYIFTIATILIVSALAVRGVGGPIRRMSGYLDLFFMGGAFLLIETKSVVWFALLFGTTWLVNALVFGGILLAVLLAVEVSRAVVLRRPAILYGCLFLALAVAVAVPASALLGLPIVPRFIVAVGVSFAPIFLANLVFAQRFRDVEASGIAFGANLLGAMLGGVLEYGSLVVGYRGLLLFAAGLYLLAFLFGAMRQPVPSH